MESRVSKLLEGIEPARPPREVALPVKTAPALETRKSSQDIQTSASVKVPDDGLTADEQAYLRTVSAFPWRLLTEIYKVLSDEKAMGTDTISQSRAVKLRKGLLKKGYLMTYNVVGTGRSGRSFSDLVTEKAGMGKAEKPRGGYLHAFWCHRVAEYFRNES